MPWSGSNRKRTLPSNWATLRIAVLRRDGWECQWVTGGRICAAAANQCDHIGDPLDHSMENLRALCAWHHGKRSGSQGAKASNARPSARRPPEAHPGIR